MPPGKASGNQAEFCDVLHNSLIQLKTSFHHVEPTTGNGIKVFLSKYF